MFVDVHDRARGRSRGRYEAATLNFFPLNRDNGDFVG